MIINDLWKVSAIFCLKVSVSVLVWDRLVKTGIGASLKDSSKAALMDTCITICPIGLYYKSVSHTNQIAIPLCACLLFLPSLLTEIHIISKMNLSTSRK